MSGVDSQEPAATTSGQATAAGTIAEYLSAQGVDRVYGLPGGHVKPIWNELHRAGIRIISTRHECAAVHMAQADADLTRRLAVAVVTAGPGFTNAITGIACAHLANSPVLVISARPPRPQEGMGALEEIPQSELVRPITRLATTISHPRHVLSRLDQATYAALGNQGGPGPAYVDFPVDVLHETPPPAPRSKLARRRVPLAPDPQDVRAAAEVIRQARRLMILSGGGGAEDAQAMIALVAHTRAVYFDTRASRGAVPDDLDGYVPAARRRGFAEADVVITLGRSLDFELAYGSPALFQSDPKFVRIGRTWEETGSNRPGDVEIQADVGLAIAAIMAEGAQPRDPDAAWREQLVARNREKIEAAKLTAGHEPIGADGRMHPNTLLAHVNRHIDDDTIVIADGGDILSFARTGLRARTYLDVGAFGCLGVGVPFAVASALRYPHRRTVAVIGDGAFGFNAMELETAVRERAHAVFVVANNEAWNIERHDQLNNYDDGPLGTELGRCRYDELARSLGAHGERVEDASTLSDALRQAFTHMPALVDVAVTRDAVSADTKSGLAQVPPLQALKSWDDAERLRIQTINS